MMRRSCGGGISHLTEFSARDEWWPAYATLRRGTAYVDRKSRRSDEVLTMGDVSSFGARADAELGQDI
jgi:hypothetical protein